MDLFAEPKSGAFEPAPVLDSRAPPPARALLMLCHFDAQIEKLWLEQMNLVRSIDEMKREARAAHVELRAQEIEVMFVESSSRYAAPAEAIRRMREWLDGARARCAELSTRVQSETEVTARAFDAIHRRVELLCERKRAVPVAPELLRLYEASAWGGASGRVVAVERDACGACGAAAPRAQPESGLQVCVGCRRVLYWRHAG
jgi:hypothetical protein